MSDYFDHRLWEGDFHSKEQEKSLDQLLAENAYLRSHIAELKVENLALRVQLVQATTQLQNIQSKSNIAAQASSQILQTTQSVSNNNDDIRERYAILDAKKKLQNRKAKERKQRRAIQYLMKSTNYADVERLDNQMGHVVRKMEPYAFKNVMSQISAVTNPIPRLSSSSGIIKTIQRNLTSNMQQ
jgi:hypothetical protein